MRPYFNELNTLIYLSICKSLQVVRHVAVHFWRYFALSQWITDGCVEASRNKDEVRVELNEEKGMSFYLIE